MVKSDNFALIVIKECLYSMNTLKNEIAKIHNTMKKIFDPD